MKITKQMIEDAKKSKVRGSWYDYSNEQNNASAMPPVGSLCLSYDADGWQDCLFIGFDSDGLLVCELLGDDEFKRIDKSIACFRAINYETIKGLEKRYEVVSEASAVFQANCMQDYSGQPFLDGLSALYDAGMLVAKK
jgi:hypothetical protein